MSQTATEEEMMRYTTAYIATSNALGDAIIILKRLEAMTFDPSESLALVNERRALEDQYAINERRFIRLHAGEISMHPPSQPQVDAIVELASRLAQMTLKKVRASEAVAVAKMVAAKFDELNA